MKRIDHATAVTQKFTEGNAVTGTPATRVTADWLNTLQEEIAHVVEQASITLDQTGADTTQVFDAIVAIIAANTTNAIQFASNAEALAGTEAGKVLSPATFGTQQSKSGVGYQVLPGGIIFQWGVVLSNPSGVAVTLPIAFPNQGLVPMASGANSNNVGANAYGLTQTTITVQQLQTSGNFGCNWYAIGY